MRVFKSTKIALFTSVILLLLSCAMLFGTTYAWFIDSVESGNNRIIAGNLDVDLLMKKGENYVSIAEDDGDIVAESLGDDVIWEPGDTEVIYLEVRNKGSLALKYNLKLEVKDNGLASALQYAILDDENGENAIDLEENDYDDMLYEGLVPVGTGRLNPEHKADYFAIALHMPDNTPDDYGKNDSVTVDICLLATQDTYEGEEDSFGTDYDADAGFEDAVDSQEDFKKAVEAGGSYILEGDFILKSDISKDLTLNLNQHTLTLEKGYKLTNGADLTVTNGTVVTTEENEGFIDVRAVKSDESLVTFRSVNFINETEPETEDEATDRLAPMVMFHAEEAKAEAVLTFKACTFDNAKVLFEGYDKKVGEFEATFENCTFNALTSSAPIEASENLKGSIVVNGCIFNLEATSSDASAIIVDTTDNKDVKVTATDNDLNARVAEATDEEVTGAEAVKVLGKPRNITLVSEDSNAKVKESGTNATGIAISEEE